MPSDLDMMALIRELFPLRRDLVSPGLGEALRRLARWAPLEIEAYPTGSEAWTWIVPPRWQVREAWIEAGGRRLVDLADHPLHVMSYSQPVDAVVSRQELLAHLFTRPDQPKAVPFEFSYYRPAWGFCVQHERLGEFDAPEYRVFIDSEFSEGELELGAWTLPGASRREILLLAHLCHPCMANDDLSGVAVLAAVHRRLAAKPRRYTYRFLVGPETIGSLAYLSAHERLIPRLDQGLFLEMLGHDDAFSLQRSRQEDSPLDLALELALAARGEPFRTGGFRRVVRNDEGVVNGPGVEVPCPSLSRAAPWSEGGAPFPQYHTSADTPDILDQGRLEEAAGVVLDALEMVEADYLPVRRFRGPVFLSRYGLWVDWRSDRELNAKQDEVLHLLEGDLSLLQIARRLELDFWVLHGWLEEFRRHGLLDARPEPEPA